MKKTNALLFGIIITIVIAVLSVWVSRLINFKTDFIPNSIVTHSTMLILAISAIFLFKKHVNFHVSIPNFKSIIKPIIFGFIVSAIGQIITGIVISKQLLNGSEIQMPGGKMSALQTFVFVFFYASLAEEMLYRGFLQNFLEPLKENGIKLINKKISIPVFVGALFFGLSHLILVKTGANNIFVIGIVISSFLVGVVAGYYQEKNNNYAHALVTHMSANLFGLIGVLIMSSGS